MHKICISPSERVCVSVRPWASGACKEHNSENCKIIDDIKLKITRKDQQLNFQTCCEKIAVPTFQQDLFNQKVSRNDVCSFCFFSQPEERSIKIFQPAKIWMFSSFQPYAWTLLDTFPSYSFLRWSILLGQKVLNQNLFILREHSTKNF